LIINTYNTTACSPSQQSEEEKLHRRGVVVMKKERLVKQLDSRHFYPTKYQILNFTSIVIDQITTLVIT